MKKITKNLGTATKVLMVALLMAGVSVDSFAQKKEKKKKEKKAKELKRPDKVGHSETDAFVTSAFDVYSKNQALTKKMSDAKGNITDAGKVKTDLEGQMKEVTSLLGKSSDVMKGAKSITPKGNSLKAVGALNKAVKALNATQKAIPGQLDKIKAQDSKK